jgi:hypothetical protein
MSKNESFNGAMRGCKDLRLAWMWKHAKRRARERYGLEINRRDRQELIARIMNGDGKFIPSRQLNRNNKNRRMWQIHYRGKDLLVIFDQRVKALVTFLPIENYQDLLKES